MKKHFWLPIVLCISISILGAIKINYIDTKDFPMVKVGVETSGFYLPEDLELHEDGYLCKTRIKVINELPLGELKVFLVIDNSNSMNSKLTGIMNFFEKAAEIIAMNSSLQTSFRVIGFSSEINYDSSTKSALDVRDPLADVLRNTGYGQPQIAPVLKELLEYEEGPSLVFIAGDDEMCLSTHESLSLDGLLKGKGIPVYLVGEDYDESIRELSEKSGGMLLNTTTPKSITGAIEKVAHTRYEFEYTSIGQYGGIHLVKLNNVESVYNATIISPPIIWIDMFPTIVRADTILNFSGKIKRGPAEMELMHNGVEVPFDIKENGDFVADLYMEEGINKIMIFASSKWGRSSTVSKILGLKPLENSLSAEIKWEDTEADLDLYVYTPLGTAYLINSSDIIELIDVKSEPGLEEFYLSEEKFTRGNYVFKVHYYEGINPINFDFKIYMGDSLVYERNLEIEQSNHVNSDPEDTGKDWVTVAEMLIK